MDKSTRSESSFYDLYIFQVSYNFAIVMELHRFLYVVPSKALGTATLPNPGCDVTGRTHLVGILTFTKHTP